MFRVTSIPSFLVLFDDLLTRNMLTIANHLGVSVKTLERYKRTGDAPRAVMLALFYESRWGYSLLQSEAHNAAQVERQHAQSLARENAMLRLRIARLEAIGGHGAANEPMLRPQYVPDALAALPGQAAL